MKNNQPAEPAPKVRPRIRFRLRRFGLRGFLLIVTVVCIGFGWWYQGMTQNSRAVEFLNREDVYFRYFRFRFNNFPEVPEIKAPGWQRRLFDDVNFLKIKMLGMSGKQASSPAFWNALKKHRHALQNVERIEVWCEGASISSESVETLSLMSGLLAIDVKDGHPSSSWLQQCRSVKSLRSLRIDSPGSPVDARDLIGLKQTRVIMLCECGISLDDAEYLRDQLRSTMIVVVENNDSNVSTDD